MNYYHKKKHFQCNFSLYNRPHNSGHYTMEACEIDQFEMHIRAVMNLPCPPPKMKVGAALMLNILGRTFLIYLFIYIFIYLFIYDS